MKAFALLLLISFMVSCSTPASTEITESDVKMEEETTLNDINTVLEELETIEMDDSKMETIQYSYKNPKQEVNMNITYSLDENNKISTLSITSDNYEGLENFNTAAQGKVIGLTLSEISDIDIIGGSSLTTAAFKEAIQSHL